MKILEIISDTNIGGAGVLLLTRLMSNKEMRDSTVVVIPTGSMLKSRLEQNGIAFLEVDACRDRSFEFSAIAKFIGAIKRLSPDIINCHGCLSFRIAAFICRVPVRFYTRHCVFPLKVWQKNRISRLLIGKAQVLLSNGIIAVAYAAKDNLVDMGVPDERIFVVINGVAEISRNSEKEREKTKKLLGIPKNSRVIGIFARLESYKGHMELIQASEILLKKDDTYYFLIVGDGSMKKELKAECKKRGIDNHIIFTGFVEDVSTYFNITDINVNCSWGTETSSLALSEGMSLGIPAVASDYGGNRHMVKDGINGYIYPSGDYRALADCICRIFNDAALYEKLSKGAYDRFKTEFNSEKMAKQTYELYKKIYKLKCSGCSNTAKNN